MLWLLNVSVYCNDPGLALLLVTVKKFMNILWIIGPILAIIGAGIALFKLMSNPDEKKYKNLFQNMLIALIILFLLPAIVNVVMRLFDGQFELASCWNQAEVISGTSTQNSHYIDPNGNSKNPIYTDPGKYQTGTKEPEKATSSYHKNSVNRVRYNVYYQNDSRWGAVKYPNGSTINEIGNMISAVAVVASSVDGSITPKTVFDSSYRHSYPRDAINGLTKGAFSCSAGSVSATNIKNALAGGRSVIIKVRGSQNGGKSTYTTSQHYMALLDYRDGQVFVGNGYSTGGTGVAGWHDVNKVLVSVQEADYCTPNQQVLSKYGS